METAAGRPTASTVVRPTGQRCRWCREPVTVVGAPLIGRAFHTATGEETGQPDGHLAAPIDGYLAPSPEAAPGTRPEGWHPGEAGDHHSGPVPGEHAR
jgi:hypothetical protein